MLADAVTHKLARMGRITEFCGHRRRPLWAKRIPLSRVRLARKLWSTRTAARHAP